VKVRRGEGKKRKGRKHRKREGGKEEKKKEKGKDPRPWPQAGTEIICGDGKKEGRSAEIGEKKKRTCSRNGGEHLLLPMLFKEKEKKKPEKRSSEDRPCPLR